MLWIGCALKGVLQRVGKCYDFFTKLSEVDSLALVDDHPVIFEFWTHAMMQLEPYGTVSALFEAGLPPKAAPSTKSSGCTR